MFNIFLLYGGCRAEATSTSSLKVPYFEKAKNIGIFYFLFLLMNNLIFNIYIYISVSFALENLTYFEIIGCGYHQRKKNEVQNTFLSYNLHCNHTDFFDKFNFKFGR